MKKEENLKVVGGEDPWIPQDGPSPRLRPDGCYDILCAVPLTLQPKTSFSFQLHLKCKVPVHMFQAKSVLDRGVALFDGGWASSDANVPLSLTLVNSSEERVMFDPGDTLARAFLMTR